MSSEFPLVQASNCGLFGLGILHALIATIARKGKLRFRVDSGLEAFI